MVSSTPYNFTQDWFGQAPPIWEQLIPILPARENFLEVGSFEGRSAVWILEHMMGDKGSIWCIDTWSGSEEHPDAVIKGCEERFDHNLLLACARNKNRQMVKIKGDSFDSLCELTQNLSVPPFDFIYIDGSHIARDVLTDACIAWKMLKRKGVMVFDDYLWGEPRDILHRPKLAVDAFANLFVEELDIVHMGYQFAAQKK